MEIVVTQRQLDAANAEFWDELCGTTMARQLGITEPTQESLRRFDQHYFSFYPYLDRHIPFLELCGENVLEVGLGFGSVAQRIAESGANYTGLDIASGPVNAVRQRLRLAALDGTALRGNILNAPFSERSFDRVFAIGCYHHTGNLQLALDETWRLLRPGGHATVMVYNALSYRRWLTAPFTTFFHSVRGKAADARPSAQVRGSYDSDGQGRPAPETVFVSRGDLHRMTERFSDIHAELENASVPFVGSLRSLACKTVGRTLGLDLYVHLTR